MTLGSAGECAGCSSNASNYCTAGTSSTQAGSCAPSMTATGAASSRNLAPFTLGATSVPGNKQGLVFYGVNGASASPWGMGMSASSSFLCVHSPTQRTGAQNSGGSGGSCNGQIKVDFNKYMATHPGAQGNPFPAGLQVWAQVWYRDPNSPNTTSLSDGLVFFLCP